MKKITALLLSFLLILALCACGASNGMVKDEAYFDSESPSASEDYYESPENGGYISSESKTDFPSVDSSVYHDPDAKVIRTAKMTIQTTEFNDAVSALSALTESLNGYYETSQVDGGNYNSKYVYRTAYFVVRIPKENFAAFRDSVGDVGHVSFFAEDAKNVGEEYYDTETRLATLETKHERLLALLEKATVMEDIITLENALADVEYQMDRYNTTLRKYDSLISYSTFTINLNEVARIVDEPEVTEGFGRKLANQLTEGFSAFAEGLQNFTLWLARNIITLVIIAAIIFVIVRVFVVRARKRRAKYNQTSE